MKLFTSIAAAAAVIGSLFIAVSPAEARNCPPGTRYQNIQYGGLIKYHVAEGCFSDFEANNLRINAQNAHRS